jgi:hypothetical protein
MNADQIASQFYQQRPEAERWLTQKQAAWLMNTFRNEAQRFERGMGDTAAGALYKGDDQIGTWELHISHLNDCGLFKVSLYAVAETNTNAHNEAVKAGIAALRQMKEQAEGDATAMLDQQIELLVKQLI